MKDGVDFNRAMLAAQLAHGDRDRDTARQFIALAAMCVTGDSDQNRLADFIKSKGYNK